MTPNELLQAKIAEVRRRSHKADQWLVLDEAIRHAFAVERDWQPKVDPDLLLAREIAASRSKTRAEAAWFLEGKLDDLDCVTEPLAIIRAHRAKHAEETPE